jgi:xanthine dehydrogenase molybdenum-binding subunit
VNFVLALRNDNEVLLQETVNSSKKLTVVGSKQAPFEARAKLTGGAKFGEDIYFPNLLYGKILRSEYAHAKIVSLDTSEAEKFDGVHAIITFKDFSSADYASDIKDQTILADQKVLYYGQPICVLAAETSEIAESALAKIKIEYQQLPVISSIDDALREESVEIHPEVRNQGLENLEMSKNISSFTRIQKGDPKHAFSEADFFLEETYETQRVHQCPIEPKASTAFAHEDGKIVVWTSTQSPFVMRTALSKILSLSVNQIQVISTAIGGGFGSKIFPEIEAFCALLSKKSNRPVKIVLTREEEFVAGTPRAGIRFWIKSAVRHGKITAREGKAIVDSGAFASEGAVYANLAALQMIGPYSIDNVKIEAVSVYTNKQPVGAFRAPGSMETAFAVESHTDSLAKKGRMDPVEFRIRNLAEDGDRGPTGQVLHGVGAKDVLRRVADRINWKDRKLSRSAQNESPQIWRGIGFSCGLIPTVGIHASGAIVRMEEDGQVILETGAQDIGTGALMGLKMIVAEELGVSCEEIELRNGDTSTVPYDGGAQGSRTTYGAGNAALFAARDAKNQILEAASRVLEIPKNDLFLEVGKVRVRDSSKSLSFRELANFAFSRFGGPIIGRGSFAKDFPEYDKTSVGGYVLCPSFHDPAYVAHAAEIQVNIETGAVNIVRYIAAHDVGTAINPVALEGQIYGGAVQGIGYALLEKMLYDEGRLGSSMTFNEYMIPKMTDIPPIETLIIEGHYGSGPYGAKGVGEANIVPPAGAIANAIFDAIGAKITRLPISFDELSKGLSERCVT